MKRREFIRNTGWFAVGAALVGVPGCTSDASVADEDAKELDSQRGIVRVFPQGVASGDPRATSIVLWTRVALDGVADGACGPLNVRVQVSGDSRFTRNVVDHEVVVTGKSDHTVRVLITGLAPATSYFYRFVAGASSTVGRTRTAPAANAEVQVNLAWVSCQDYTPGNYGAYRQLLIDDDARAEADKIHAVVHLGDTIYETRNDVSQLVLDDNFEPIELVNRDGSPREVAPFPVGGTRAGVDFAQTVDDYRHLYKTFLSDPDLQAARARWPFVTTWDDHEFSDDSWESQANYTNEATLDEPDQTRRVAASQAWFEYSAVQLTGAGGVAGVPSQAKDFAPVTVSDAPFTAPNADNFVPEPNNAAAIGAITIYRSFRFGKHVELVMTDERSYRSDHAIPEELTNNPVFFAPRNVLPLPLVNTLDAGVTANGGNPPASVSFLGGAVVFPNVRAGSPPGTMLGKRQKQWWKDTMKRSDATWKLWGNEVTLMRLKIQQLGATDVSDRVVSGDSWDGYATERNELMGFLRAQAIQNVVVLSGDIHAAFAGTIADNFDADLPVPVACELVVPGISSNSLFSFFELATRAADPALRSLITVDASAVGGSRFTENFNLLVLDGVQSAGTFAGAVAQGAPPPVALGAALAVADPTTNPHLRYVDSNAQGYGYAKITADAIAATIVTINRPIATATDAGPGTKRTASFTIPKNNPAGMIGPVVTGTRPFPLI